MNPYLFTCVKLLQIFSQLVFDILDFVSSLTLPWIKFRHVQCINDSAPTTDTV